MSTKTPIINMLKTDMDNIIDVPLPKGYTIRSYTKGDREKWAELYDSIDDYIDITPELFDRFFGDDHSLLSKSMFFLCFKGKEIGTVTDWPEDNIGGVKTGRLHWIGVDKSHRGKHLGAALVSFILKKMSERGCESCILGTGERRIAALNMYFEFGFLPYVYTDKHSPMQDQKESWKRVKQNIRSVQKDKIDF